MSERKPNLYPLRFHPIFNRKIWGGSSIYKYKMLPSPFHDIGETWEISPMQGEVSIVSTGPLAGKSLNEVVEEYGPDLLGHQVYHRYNGHFPLLVKLIDARETLSVQVHPDDNYAMNHHQSFGKSEMWYMLDCDEGAMIYAGWKKNIEPNSIHEICEKGEIMEYLRSYRPRRSDLFYLPAGMIHTIGAGCMLMEIQQASDLTYRVYDFKRKDSQGNHRELHIKEACEVLDFSLNVEAKVEYNCLKEEKRCSILETPYFNVGQINISTQYLYDIHERDSFTIFFIDEGNLMLEIPNGVEHLKKGDFMLLPASLNECSLMPITPSVKIIDCYVPSL